VTTASGVRDAVATPRLRWLAVRVRLPDADPSVSDTPPMLARRQAVTDLLIARGSAGVHEDGVALVAHYREGSVDEMELRRSVTMASAGARVNIGWVEDVDWTRQWRTGLGSHRVGTLTVMPPWLAEHADPTQTIVIDPGMAFGTGDHPTTRGVLELMQGVVRSGDLVVDIGTGSGILAIAAARLGARCVAAIEIDGDAISNAECNVAANGVADRVQVIEGDGAALLPMLAPVDVVVANILSSVLVELLPSIAQALSPGGRVVLGGILTEERAVLSARLMEQGWRLAGDTVEGAWWSGVVERT
jgi:ribosomal protein L11 methyltransferase